MHLLQPIELSYGKNINKVIIHKNKNLCLGTLLTMSNTSELITNQLYNINDLFLDPNNYRFVDNHNYRPVEKSRFTDQIVQKRTRAFIEGDKRENISDLLSSFKANGYLDVDVIQVLDLGNQQYLVIEGNRRVAALKVLQEEYNSGKSDIGNLNPEIFHSLRLEVHKEDDKDKHLIVMGLKHISGNKKWAAINQAKLIFDYLKPFWNTNDYTIKETELCNSLGITKIKLRASQRTYHLILAYKQGDFGDQFSSDKYSIFDEIAKNIAIKKWLDWDDASYKAKNVFNLERLFSWLSSYDTTFEHSDDNSFTQQPIVTKAFDIRDLAIFINNETALKEMERAYDIKAGLESSGEISKLEISKALKDLHSKIKILSTFDNYFSESDNESLINIYNSFTPLVRKNEINMSMSNTDVFFRQISTHLQSINVVNYKTFKDFKLNQFTRINIITGKNNIGKTTLLEAIYLLSKQNDIASFFKLIINRNKLNKLTPIWLNRFIKDQIVISGMFNNSDTQVSISKYNSLNLDKRDDYIISYKIEASINLEVSECNIDTFRSGDLKSNYDKAIHLCHSSFKSPYYYDIEEISNAYQKCLTIKDKKGDTMYKLINEFMSCNYSGVKSITLADGDDTLQRFIVDTDGIEDNRELTSYGEGLQRMYEIALSFASCRNGIICIDELETAIHFSLLTKFTKFLQELAESFNVQVFITTHSKECLDAFIKNGYANNDITVIHLTDSNNELTYKIASGSSLEFLIQSLNLDLRGVISE